VNALDRLSEQSRDREHDDLATGGARRDNGIVLVTISLSIGDFSMRSIADPESTPCTAHAITRAARCP
jgi:hypothetical protein